MLFIKFGYFGAAEFSRLVNFVYRTTFTLLSSFFIAWSPGKYPAEVISVLKQYIFNRFYLQPFLLLFDQFTVNS